jgi:RNA polymerase sigma factor (sigma-70 family)
MIFIFYFILINLFLINSLHLTSKQINQIVKFIKAESLDTEQREKINYVLYKSYEKWAIKKAIDFKQLHKFKCKNINTQELILYSKFGLFKSIKKYNGNSPFLFYSEFYVKKELLNVVTNHFSLSIIPKSIRTKNKHNFSHNALFDYKNKLEPMLINYVNNVAFDNSHNSKQKHILDKIYEYERNMKIWEKINKLEPFSKRIIYLKYDNEFNKIRSNKIIGELMCCSEEHIRKNLQEAFKKIF